MSRGSHRHFQQIEFYCRLEGVKWVGGDLVGSQEVSRLWGGTGAAGRAGGNAGAARKAHRPCPGLDGRGTDRGRGGRKSPATYADVEDQQAPSRSAVVSVRASFLLSRQSRALGAGA